MSDAVRRAVVIVGVLAVLVGVGVADAGRGGAGAPPAGGAPFSATSSVSGTGVVPAAAESSAWYCTGGTGAGGDAPATLLFTNRSARAVTGTITAVSSDAARQSTPVSVPARSQIGVAQGLAGAAAASTVVLNGGGVGVSEIASGPLGLTAAPCASTAARHWYFADASTAQGSTLSLSLFNPTATVAVVNVSFVSSAGVVAPPAYQGIDIPGDTLVVEDVALHVPNTADFATTVSTLSGAVVASELERHVPAGSGGLSLVLGALSPASVWSYAQNTDSAGGSTVFHIFNPSDRPARVTVTFGLQQATAEPLVVRVGPLSIAALDAPTVTRLPAGTAFSATFASGGVGIVVDRHVSSPAGAAAPQQGDTPGVPAGGDRWLLTGPYAPSTAVSSLAVVNLSRVDITVRLWGVTTRGLVPVAGAGPRRVRSGSPLVLTPVTGSPIGTVPLELVASGPVAVEVDALPAGSPGVLVLPGLPLL